MNIVHIEDFFHPDTGYQINLLAKYMSRKGHDVTIVTSDINSAPRGLASFFGNEDINGRDLIYEKETGVKIIRLDVKKFISNRAVFPRKIYHTVDKLNPDILFVHGNDTLTGMRYLIRKIKLKYPLIMDSHMLEMASTNRFSRYFRAVYKKVFTPIIVKNKIVVIRTQNDDYVEKKLGIPLSLCPWISVGTDTVLFKDKALDIRNKMRSKFDINNDDFVVIYAGKLDESKGGKLLAEAFKDKFNFERKVVLIILGCPSGEYGREVKEILNKSENKVIELPTQKYVDLPQYYQMADLSVFAKQCSLSFYDVQAVGLPVVSESNEINDERCSNNNGMVFKPGDVKDFREKISKFIGMSEIEIKKYSENAVKYVKSNYDYANIVEEYLEIMEKEVIKYNG